MIKLYFDLHVHGVVFQNLISRGIDVVRGQDDNMDSVSDKELLRRASETSRLLVTSDNDFFKIVADFQSRQENFSGVLFFRAVQIDMKTLIDDLVLIASAGNQKDFDNVLTFLPL